ncbi:MAG: chromate transporter [Betaproteobacteria bacterium]|nr:MAG: chromate transporter [Betaproteobacteria bacterium]
MAEVDLPALSLHFALLSLMAIGGVSSILPDLQRYVVEANHWLSGTQFADAYALGQAAPGPNMMFVTLLGWQLAGWAGAIVATLATIVPPILLTLTVTRLSATNPNAPLGRAIRGGLGPIAIGLTLSSGWILAHSADHDWRGALLTLLTVVLMLRTKLNPMWLILAGAGAGMGGML